MTIRRAIDVPPGSNPGNPDWVFETDLQWMMRTLLHGALDLNYMMKNDINPGTLAQDTAIERSWGKLNSEDIWSCVVQYRGEYSATLRGDGGNMTKGEERAYIDKLNPEYISRRWSSRKNWRPFEEYSLESYRKGHESNSAALNRARQILSNNPASTTSPAVFADQQRIRSLLMAHTLDRMQGVSPEPIRMYVPEESLAGAQKWAEGAWTHYRRAITAGSIIPHTLAAENGAAPSATGAPAPVAVPAAEPPQGLRR
ncbi:hypothetical protein ACH4C6_36280 [Streptomyces sp. NPDC017943]|uniref:hypothetical protein n=1 Tax=Streptomyces sp. NPDC017943 TaxID=3365019 RepID=UPI003797BAE5